jgi:hypothetical protein
VLWPCQWLCYKGHRTRGDDTDRMPDKAQRAVLAIYACTIFLSALLLFSVQPMFAKMVTPLLGGASAVWAVSMCFFQVMLLLGYAWAHLLDRTVAPRIALALQVCVLALALATLPIGIASGSGDAASRGAYLQLIAILLASVGLPFFALAANAPLLQAWFSKVGHAQSANAYILYGASNSGSLAALAAYPFVVEPLLPLRLQNHAWTVGFALLAVAIVGCGWLASSAPRATLGGAPTPSPREDPSAYLRTRPLWAALAFVPSGLLVAFTTYVTTDLASAPLLWVIPLALYLLTFIAAFRDRLPISLPLLVIAQPVAVALTIVQMEWDADFAWVLSCVMGTLAFVITSLICHHELYERRPATEQLTGFYLWLSLGGALGGIFSALIAPQLFTNVFEFPLLLGLGIGLRFALRENAAQPDPRRQLLVVLAASILVALAAAYLAPWSWTPGRRVIALAVFGVALVAAFRRPILEQGAVLALVLALAFVPNGNKPLHVARTFYGTHKVVQAPNGQVRLLLHGVTLHGAQLVGEGRPEPAGRPLPLTYYHPSGPLARGLLLARAAAGGPAQPLRVGVVGLGAGAMACHARDGDSWRFFELDPEVIRIATNPSYFSYLGTCTPGAQFIVGDARLTLAKEPAASFDYLVIDAFSSDAIPIHLLTVEAIRLYVSLLAERGILALHVSNRSFDLPPIVESNVAQMQGLTAVYVQGESGGGAIRSQVVLIAKDPTILAQAFAWPHARALDQPAVRAWTDDYSDIISPFLRRLSAKLQAL